MSNGQNNNNSTALVLVLTFITLIVNLIMGMLPFVSPLERTIIFIALGLFILGCFYYVWRGNELSKLLAIGLLLIGIFTLGRGIIEIPDRVFNVGNIPTSPSPSYLAPKGTDEQDKQAFEQGMRFYESGEYQQACNKFREAINRQPNFFDAYKYLGLAYQKMEDYDNAKEPLKIAFSMNSEQIRQIIADVYYLSGQRWLRRGDKDRARRDQVYLQDYDTVLAEKLATEIQLVK
jgi:tetratricopeptide (TPR) repeat protein